MDRRDNGREKVDRSHLNRTNSNLIWPEDWSLLRDRTVKECEKI